MAADPAEAARQGNARELAVAQDRRCRGGRHRHVGRDVPDEREDRADDAGDRRGEKGARSPAKAGVQSQERRARSEEHTSELQSLMRISYAVLCLKKKKKATHQA